MTTRATGDSLSKASFAPTFCYQPHPLAVVRSMFGTRLVFQGMTQLSFFIKA